MAKIFKFKDGTVIEVMDDEGKAPDVVKQEALNVHSQLIESQKQEEKTDNKK